MNLGYGGKGGIFPEDDADYVAPIKAPTKPPTYWPGVWLMVILGFIAAWAFTMAIWNAFQ